MTNVLLLCSKHVRTICHLLSAPAISRRLGIPEPHIAWEPRYNVPPGIWIPVVWRPDPEEEIQLGEMWWGYRPRWAKEGSPQPTNAKAEAVATSRYFQAAFRKHRCLVPADG
uniref:SOS response-associated peptidase family protein n=1 Tax=Halomonas sp. TaxID=1486246 RepID=UPI00260CAE0E|nr:SOS response-associated peptidase family protein [Halomonas sp.]